MQVRVVDDGESAWRVMQKENFDVILSDIEMPHLDGIGLAKRIRADHRFDAVPLVALTSHKSPEDRLLGEQAGFDRYEIKLDRDSLAKVIHSVLAERRNEGASACS